MDQNNGAPIRPRVVVIADVQSNAIALVEKVLKPAGIEAWTESETSPEPDVLVVDVTQLMGNPLAGLRNRRSSGDNAPALVLAARFPQSRLRDFFRLGVSDILMKPYRPDELIQAITDIADTRSRERNTQSLARKLESSRENIRQRSEEIRLLSEIGRTVVNLADLERILARVTEASAFVTDAEEANIYLADPDTNELVLRASKQAGEKNATIQRIRVNDTLVGQVFRTGQAMLR
ncbi:MAG: response regulator, partial [Anaerolineales bacterium]